MTDLDELQDRLVRCMHIDLNEERYTLLKAGQRFGKTTVALKLLAQRHFNKLYVSRPSYRLIGSTEALADVLQLGDQLAALVARVERFSDLLPVSDDFRLVERPRWISWFESLDAFDVVWLDEAFWLPGVGGFFDAWNVSKTKPALILTSSKGPEFRGNWPFVKGRSFAAWDNPTHKLEDFDLSDEKSVRDFCAY